MRDKNNHLNRFEGVLQYGNLKKVRDILAIQIKMALSSQDTKTIYNGSAILANKLVKLNVFKLVNMNNMRHNGLWVNRGRLGVGMNKFFSFVSYHY